MLDATAMGQRIARLRENVGSVFLGKQEVVDDILATLLAGGHILIEDVPGVGKTTLARALARSIDCQFQRIQFTPDLLPSDILGVSVYDQAAGEFRFKAGPIFAHVLLADEVNRATPRTQSALLEAMNSAQVSVDGTTHELPRPFMVVATQNPQEFEGTFPLPESQYDRFLMRVRVGYPAVEDERRVIVSRQHSDPVDDLRPVLSVEETCALQEEVRQVRTDDAIIDYLLRLVSATRESPRLSLGASPRGSIALHRAAQARAVLDGRSFVIPDDVKRSAVPVLSHRVLPRGAPAQDTRAVEKVIEELVAETPVPL
jgi:MoxR-like ATPase